VPNGRRRARAAAVGAALAALLAGCGGPSVESGNPIPGQDPFAGLPGTASPLPVAPSASLDDKARSALPADPGPQWMRLTAEDFDTFREHAWSRYDSVGAFGNGLRRSSAITVSDGLLNVTARGNVSGGMAHELGQKYGRWEFRARSDKGRGFGSAILLWPDSERFPEDGEIDIMEVPAESRDRAHFILHFGGAANRLYGTHVDEDFSEWHTFALEWLPDRLVWYVDGVERFRVLDPNILPKTSMHLAIQLDQGPKKDWIPAPDATTPAALSLQVDWVQVYAPA
jgi:beta-glucanase (GH16 family)